MWTPFLAVPADTSSVCISGSLLYYATATQLAYQSIKATQAAVSVVLPEALQQQKVSINLNQSGSLCVLHHNKGCVFYDGELSLLKEMQWPHAIVAILFHPWYTYTFRLSAGRIPLLCLCVKMDWLLATMVTRNSLSLSMPFKPQFLMQNGVARVAGLVLRLLYYLQRETYCSYVP